MGILSENLQWMFEYIDPDQTIEIQEKPFVGKSMLELGNQFLYVNPKPYLKYPDQFLNLTGMEKIVAKPYFESIGYDHVSVDINGEDGALPLDMSKPISLERQFDVVTDFGMSEHVPNLYHCLLNIHNHTKIDGWICQINPLTGNWPGHGYWYRDEEFYEKYVKLTGYEIVAMKRFYACGNSVDGWNIWCLMRKKEISKFPTEKQFNKLPIKNI